MPVMTGLSGNEIYCLHLKGFSPGELVIEGLTAHFQFAGNIGERAGLLRRLIAAELPISDFSAERESLRELYMSGVAEQEPHP